ncbi:MAG: adaptor protein MecA [Eubacterium sp.]|nr:adaptor protein MecA [Eubacterium sp.]
MKIEKISDNQIRCTLTKEDLASRQIRLTELVYGNEKTRALFQDMMQQAYYECGFEVTGSPLMIEAIPLSADSIILIITKVENPEELDGRFSRFSPDDTGTSSEGFQSLSDILEFFSRLTQSRKNAQGETAVPSVPGQEGLDTVAEALSEQQSAAPSKTGDSKDPAGSGADQPDEEALLYDLTRFFLFRNLETCIRAAQASDPFDGISSLYKNPDDGNYYLILQKAEAPADQFNRVCNILSEY